MIETIIGLIFHLDQNLSTVVHHYGMWTYLILFCIIFPAPFFLHRFWKETDSYMRLSEFAHMMKDFALAGGALIVAAVT